MTTNGDRSDRELVLDELREASKLLVVTHENPDGDAIGSLVAMRGILSAMGKDCLMFIDAHDLPLPKEYRFFPLVGTLVCRNNFKRVRGHKRFLPYPPCYPNIEPHSRLIHPSLDSAGADDVSAVDDVETGAGAKGAVIRTRMIDKEEYHECVIAWADIVSLLAAEGVEDAYVDGARR